MIVPEGIPTGIPSQAIRSMTIFAFCLLNFVDHIGDWSICTVLMTAGTGNLLVLSVKYKPGLVVIKFINIPETGYVATGTIC